MSNYIPPMLPLDMDLEMKQILKKLPSARDALAELRGVCTSIPNQDILISTLSLQEAKDSSAIENIISLKVFIHFMMVMVVQDVSSIFYI